MPSFLNKWRKDNSTKNTSIDPELDRALELATIVEPDDHNLISEEIKYNASKKSAINNDSIAKDTVSIKKIIHNINCAKNCQISFNDIILLTKTPNNKWSQYFFVSNDTARSKLINFIENEIKIISTSDITATVKKNIIYPVLSYNNTDKVFADEILRNMYIARLQNIIILLVKHNDNGKSNQQNKNHNIIENARI